MQGNPADLVFSDPPYNVPIDGHVLELGQTRHREFAMGVGEITSSAFTTFLQDTLGAAAAVSKRRDRVRVYGLAAHGRAVGRRSCRLLRAKNLSVWNKTNGGMGTFYRSKHELVFVFKVGTAPIRTRLA
jgi:hypothetical protein